MGELTLEYAEHAHAPRGRVTSCLGLVAVGATQYAHAVLATRGEWVTNEKQLLERAGLGVIDQDLADVGDPAVLAGFVGQVRQRARGALALAQ